VTRSVPAGTVSGDSFIPVNWPLTTRIHGILRRPRATMRVVAAHPQWAGLLLVCTLASAAAGTGFLTTAVGRQALVDQWERTADAFGQDVDDAGYARLQETAATSAPLYGLAGALLTGPILAFAVAGVVTLAGRGRVSMAASLAVAAHAGVILTLRQVITAPINYVRETTASATTLAAVLPSFDEASPVSRFLGTIDLFVLWWAIVLSVGIALLLQARARTVAGVVIGLYVFMGLVSAAAMALTGGA